MRVRHNLRRWHIWLGWIVGVPMLFWILSGVIMVWKPNEEVRGTDLLRDPPPVRLTAPPVVPAQVAGMPVDRLALEARAAGPRWVIQVEGAPTRTADALSGALLPPVSAADAAREVTARYLGEARVAEVRKVDPAKPPIEFRRSDPAWAVHMTDGTHFYVDAGSGEIVARRTRWWRLYDWMWGLHIMNLDTRENTHNPWIVAFGIIALLTTLMALVLLPLTGKWKRRRAR